MRWRPALHERPASARRLLTAPAAWTRPDLDAAVSSTSGWRTTRSAPALAGAPRRSTSSTSAVVAPQAFSMKFASSGRAHRDPEAAQTEGPSRVRRSARARILKTPPNMASSSASPPLAATAARRRSSGSPPTGPRHELELLNARPARGEGRRQYTMPRSWRMRSWAPAAVATTAPRSTRADPPVGVGASRGPADGARIVHANSRPPKPPARARSSAAASGAPPWPASSPPAGSPTRPARPPAGLSADRKGSSATSRFEPRPTTARGACPPRRTASSSKNSSRSPASRTPAGPAAPIVVERLSRTSSSSFTRTPRKPRPQSAKETTGDARLDAKAPSAWPARARLPEGRARRRGSHGDGRGEPERRSTSLLSGGLSPQQLQDHRGGGSTSPAPIVRRHPPGRARPAARTGLLEPRCPSRPGEPGLSSGRRWATSCPVTPASGSSRAG